VIFAGAVVAALDIFLQGYFRTQNFGLANRGVSFGLGQNFGNTVSLLAYGFFVVWFIFQLFAHKNGRRLVFLALGGGANLIARVFWGSVWDYVCLPFLPFCFNLADVLICLGVVSYILGVNGNRGTIRGQGNFGNQQAGGVGGKQSRLG
jgi:hypothetical protein